MADVQLDVLFAAPHPDDLEIAEGRPESEL